SRASGGGDIPGVARADELQLLLGRSLGGSLSPRSRRGAVARGSNVGDARDDREGVERSTVGNALNETESARGAGARRPGRRWPPRRSGGPARDEAWFASGGPPVAARPPYTPRSCARRCGA